MENSMMTNDTQNKSGVAQAQVQDASRAAPAPVIFVAVLLAGVLLSLAFPVPFFPREVRLIVGAACFLLPFILGFAAMRAMRRARTSVIPSRPTTALLTEGPFRLTRNPMYLGMAVQYVGLALLFDSLWAIVLLPLALVIVHFTVIKREERYLDRKFGDEYRAYKARVRRWI